MQPANGWPKPYDIKEALRAGVNNYVVKPFTPDTIKDKIASAIGA